MQIKAYDFVNMKIMNNLIFSLLLILMINNFSYCQVKNIGIPEIRNYKKSDYNGGTQNWNIDQDKNGNIFFANNNGLIQFNGISWSKHLMPNSNSVRSLKIDKSGKIFIGSFNEFGYFEPNQKGKLVYHSISKALNLKTINAIDFIWKIHIYNDEVVFQSFQNLYCYKNNKLRVFKAPNKFQFSFLVNNILFIQDKIYGLLKYENGKLQVLQNTNLLNNTEIWSMISLDDNKILIATLDKGLFIYKNEKINSWNNEANNFVKNNSCLGGIAIENKFIVLNSVLGGMIICDKSGRITQQINQKKGLQNNTILTSFVDNKNNLWLGLDNGIAFVNENSPFSFFGSSANISSVYSSVVFKNKLYVATNQGLFFSIIDKNSKNEIFELVSGTNGQAWNIQAIDNQLFCAHNRGAFLVNNNNSIKILDKNGYWNFKILANNSNLMIASNYNSFSIFEKNSTGWKFKNHIKGFSNPAASFEMDNENLWFKKDEMIYQLKISEDFKSFKSVKTFKNLSNIDNGISSIQTLNSKIYFQTNNHFYNYNSVNNNFIEDKSMSKLFEKKPKAKSIFEDKLGNFWFPFNESIGVLMKLNGKYVDKTSQFSNLTGNLVNNYVSINATSSNNIFIGLTDGLAHFNSNSNEIQSKPKAYFSVFSYANDTLFLANSDKKPKEISIKYNDNNVKFSFSSPIFENPKSVSFSYQLEGFDDYWSSFSLNSFKEYTNLHEGNYKMKLKSRNSFGIESETETIGFSVAPPFYRSFFAYLFYIIATGFVIYVISLRIKAKIRKNKYYETIEQRKLYLEKESRIRQEQYELEKEIEKLKNEKLKISILNKDKELVSNSLQVVKKNKIFSEIITKIKDIDIEKLDETTKNKFNKLNKSINKEVNPDKNWSELEKHIKNVHFEFLKRLKDKYPTISPRELDLSTYLLMNMSTKEIAEIMNISGPGVELARYRLRKKLYLTNKENLTGFMMSI